MNMRPSSCPLPHARFQHGIVLVSALLLLLVMTILAMTMFRTNGVQELIAGNVREKQRAIQTAEDAEQYAESWLSTSANALTPSTDCTAVGLVPYTATSIPAICATPVEVIDTAKNVTTVPWKVGANEVGFVFFPGSTTGGPTNTGDLTVAAAGTIVDSYYQAPRFYIGLLQYAGPKAMYRIDAWNWGGTQSTTAVVESNYVVTNNTANLGLL